LEDRLLTPKEVKTILAVSLPLIYKMANQGRLACVRWGCQPGDGKRAKTMLRFKLKDVQAFIEQHYQPLD
jgi:predicted DNA-binding transcriptional regulator AlpA